MISYIGSNLWQVWALVFVVCLIAELFSGGFFIICFAIGGFFAALCSLVGGVYAQLGVFVAATAVSVFVVRPFALRYLHKGDAGRPSNADALSGRIGVVSQRIEPGGYGRVAIDGDDWKAQCAPGVSGAIEQGERVRVVGRESIILSVEPVSEKE